MLRSSPYQPKKVLADRVSNIFNDQFGNISWTDADRVRRMITQEIPVRVEAESLVPERAEEFRKQNGRIEHDKALGRVMTALLKDDTQLFTQFSDNESFQKWLTDMMFGMTYEAET